MAADIAPHDVAIYVQNELLPGVMGQVEKMPPDFSISLTITHRGLRNRLIEAKIRQLYNLQPGDGIRIIPGEIHNNLIKYEIYDSANLQAVHRPKKAGGRRRSTRRTKRRSTRRLKPRRHTK